MRETGGIVRHVARAVAVVAAVALAGAPALVRVGSAQAAGQAGCPWVGEAASPDARAAEVLQQMTTSEKAELLALHYGPAGYENTVGPIPRLCIPMLTLQDGPAGVAAGLTGVTQLPAPIALAATFDASLATAYGQVQGTEARGKGVDVVQGPMVDIARVPESGRVFEGYGEDPYLTTRIAEADIAAIQGQGAMAMIKHLVANNQETNRLTINEMIDERTLREIYLPPFESTLAGQGAAAVMCAYDQVNSVYSCQSPTLLTALLKNAGAFPGFVRSDLGAVHDLAAAYNAGIDQYKPSDTEALVRLVDAGVVPVDRVDDAVSRVLRQMFAYGLFDQAPSGTATTTVTTPDHAAVAFTVAARSAVLLKNAGDALPFGRSLRRLTVAGPGASAAPITSGGGSSRVSAPHVVTPLAALRKRAGINVRVAYAASSLTGAQIRAAATSAAHSNAAVVFVGTVDTEGVDRKTLSLPPAQDRLVEAVARANPRTIVVVTSGGPVVMPWVSRVAGVVESWYPGQESGSALAALLFGDINFSGKLPVSFPWHTGDTPVASAARWPGVNGVASYDEGLDVGYRWYLHHRIPVMFPFGWGLSYTTFRVSGLHVTPTGDGGASVDLTVANVGPRAGIATPQVYVQPPAAAGEPSRQLKAFGPVSVPAGRSAHVSLDLSPSAFNVWDVTTHTWARPAGRYVVYAGTSSRYLPVAAAYDVAAAPAPPPTG